MGAALLVGALLGLYAGGSQRVIYVVMAFGAGVLIFSVAFELMEEAYRKGARFARHGAAPRGARLLRRRPRGEPTRQAP